MHACEIVSLSVPCVCGVIVSTAGAAHGPWGVWALDTGKNWRRCDVNVEGDCGAPSPSCVLRECASSTSCTAIHVSSTDPTLGRTHFVAHHASYIFILQFRVDSVSLSELFYIRLWIPA